MTRNELKAAGYIRVREVAKEAQLSIEAAFLRKPLTSVYPSDGYEPWIRQSQHSSCLRKFKAEAAGRAKDRRAAAKQRARIKKAAESWTLADWQAKRKMYARLAKDNIGYQFQVKRCDKYIAKIEAEEAARTLDEWAVEREHFAELARSSSYYRTHVRYCEGWIKKLAPNESNFTPAPKTSAQTSRGRTVAPKKKTVPLKARARLDPKRRPKKATPTEQWKPEWSKKQYDKYRELQNIPSEWGDVDKIVLIWMRGKDASMRIFAASREHVQRVWDGLFGDGTIKGLTHTGQRWDFPISRKMYDQTGK